MGIIKKGYFIKIHDSDKRLLALYSNDSLICCECAKKVDYESWNPDKTFIKKWLKPQFDGSIENSLAWCDKCGKILWDSHEGQFSGEFEDDAEIDGWLDEIDEDADWLDNLDNDSENPITIKNTPFKKIE